MSKIGPLVIRRSHAVPLADLLLLLTCGFGHCLVSVYERKITLPRRIKGKAARTPTAKRIEVAARRRRNKSRVQVARCYSQTDSGAARSPRASRSRPARRPFVAQPPRVAPASFSLHHPYEHRRKRDDLRGRGPLPDCWSETWPDDVLDQASFDYAPLRGFSLSRMALLALPGVRANTAWHGTLSEMGMIVVSSTLAVAQVADALGLRQLTRSPKATASHRMARWKRPVLPLGGGAPPSLSHVLRPM